MAFELPPLPYSTSALAGRGMCQETLELHHGQHPQAYVTALNGFVEKDPQRQGKSLEEIVKLSNGRPDMAPVFNNAGQHWNHILFWQAMSPNGGSVPGSLEQKIAQDFGSVDKFKEQFKTAAVSFDRVAAPSRRCWRYLEPANHQRFGRRFAVGSEYLTLDRDPILKAHRHVVRRTIRLEVEPDEPDLG